MGVRWRRVIAGGEGAGALMVVGFVGWLWWRWGIVNGGTAAILAYVLAVAALALFGAVQLWRDRRSGYLVSMLVLALQVPVVECPRFVHKLALGATFAFTTRVTDASFAVELGGQLGSVFRLRLPGPDWHHFGVDLVPLVFLVQVVRGWRTRGDAETSGATSAEGGLAATRQQAADLGGDDLASRLSGARSAPPR